MSATPDRRRGRGGLGKYLRARGRRTAGRPAEFAKRVSLVVDEENDVEEGEEDDEQGEGQKYAHRQLGTNVDRYEEPESDPQAAQETELQVDLSAFVARQRLPDQNDLFSYKEEYDDDDVDYSLSNLPSSSSSTSKVHKNKTHHIEWDASMDELKREKEAAEAVRDLKTRFRKHQTSSAPFTLHQSSHGHLHAVTKVEDSRHVSKRTDPCTTTDDSDTKPDSKAEMEEFLEDLLS